MRVKTWLAGTARPDITLHKGNISDGRAPSGMPRVADTGCFIINLIFLGSVLPAGVDNREKFFDRKMVESIRNHFFHVPSAAIR